MSDPDETLRRGTDADAEACAAIMNAAIDRTEWLPRMKSAEDIRTRYRDVVLAKREVCVIGDPARAYIGLSDDDEVTSLYNAEPGTGRGKRLLDHAKGLRWQLWLWTFVANLDARRFYLREGFTEQRREEGANEEGLPDILYRWEAA